MGTDPELQNLLPLMPRIRRAAFEHGVDPHIVAAIVMTESGGNPWAMRSEAKVYVGENVDFRSLWRYFFPQNTMNAMAGRAGISIPSEYVGQMTSWGLMQIMGTVAREHGFEGSFPELCHVSTNLKYGCRHLRSKMQHAGHTIEDAVAAYNAGSVRKTKGGMYENQVYVDRVMGYHRQITKV